MLVGCTPWPVELAERYRRKGYWEDVSLGEMLNRSARDHAGKPALIFGQRRISYRELVETSDGLAAGLIRAGLAPRDPGGSPSSQHPRNCLRLSGAGDDGRDPGHGVTVAPA